MFAEDAPQALWGFRRCLRHGQAVLPPLREDFRQMLGASSGVPESVGARADRVFTARIESFLPRSGKRRRGIVRINARRQRWTKNVKRLCGTELAPFRKRGGTVQLEIFAAAEMALLIEMILYG